MLIGKAKDMICKDCHKEIHKKFGNKTNKEQLKLFLN